MERRAVDAMGVETWVSVNTWMLSRQSLSSASANSSVVALKMLLDPGPVVGTNDY